ARSVARSFATQVGAISSRREGMARMSAPETNKNASSPGFSRRTWLLGGSVAAALASAGLVHHLRREKARVFIAKNQSYAGDLARTIRDGLVACGVVPESLRGKRVLLKPNMVEPIRESPHMTTHPAIVLAAADVFRTWGATVSVGEGPGHLRDTDLALFESGIGEAIDSAKLLFADLNYQEVGFKPNCGRRSKLKGFYFPRAVVEADLIVSLPKMKTHHWVGVTASMKNLYGTIPGCKYGWPKNVLHYSGIPQTVFDINASLPRAIALVDGIDCMEGGGPTLGQVKRIGLGPASTVP